MAAGLEGGNETDGFSIVPDTGSGVLRARAWGFWSDDLARAFADALVRSAFTAKRAEIDACGLKPQPDSVQAILGACLGRAAAVGANQMVFTTENAITKLQLARIMKTHAPHVATTFRASTRRVA
jgi:hypothetical protein